MLTRLHKPEILADFFSVQSQLTMEMELKQFFVVTPAPKIAEEFKHLSGSVLNQFAYLNLVLKVIRELNVEPVQTFALLQAVRPVIHHKFQAATSRFIGKPVSNSSPTGAIVFEAIELFTRLTDTYDGILNEARRFGDSQTFIVGSAIHMALADKVKLVLCYLQLYQEVPEQIWKNANRLYLIAVESNVLSQIFHDKLAFPLHALTVRQVYIYLELLGCSGSRSLSTDEISALAEFLKDWVKLANLVKFDKNSTELRLCIDPAKMSVPAFSEEITDIDSPTLVSFDLSKVRDKLGKSFVIQKFVEGVRYTLSPWASRKILDNWTTCYQRASARVLGEKKLLVARVGMTSVPDVLPDPEADLADVLSDGDLSSRKLQYEIGFVEQQIKPLVSLAGEKSLVFRANVVDYSAAGYCLEWGDKAASLLSINEMIVVQEKGEAFCKLGQVVWMKTRAKSYLQTGISVVAQKAFPVAVHVASSGYYRNDGERISGLVTSNNLEGRQHHGLFFRNKGLKTGQFLELAQGGQRYSVKLLEPLGHNDKYQFFNIAVLER